MDPPSSSSLSSPPSLSCALLPNRPTWDHDVFLCFRGEDTREGFTGHLYHALKVNCGINTFMDEQLAKGKEISELLEKIERSRIAVVIFSPNFASSQWCLDELVKIMECHKGGNTAGHEVLPVFYKVAPTELRGPKGKTAEYLATIGERDPEKVETWRLALEMFSYLTGWTFSQGAESGLIMQIVEVVRSRVYQISLEVEAGDNKEPSQDICTKVANVASIVFAVCIFTLCVAFLVIWIKGSIEVGLWSSMWYPNKDFG